MAISSIGPPAAPPTVGARGQERASDVEDQEPVDEPDPPASAEPQASVVGRTSVGEPDPPERATPSEREAEQEQRGTSGRDAERGSRLDITA
jgi:hypothetical protein